MVRPSGVHWGPLLDLSPDVKGRASAPSASEIHRWVSISLLSAVIRGAVTVKTARRPSGEGWTSPTESTFIVSAAVQPGAFASWGGAASRQSIVQSRMENLRLLAREGLDRDVPEGDLGLAVAVDM